MKIKTGIGIDIHPLAEGREFWLGGIKIEHEKGCVAHSDGDVLIHAICDALLGAAGLGDIGSYFPDTDPAYKGIDSKILLKRVAGLVEKQGFTIGNIDCVVCLQRPKIKAYVLDMRQCLAEILHMEIVDLTIKATTTEHLGFEGREEGVSAYASVLMIKL
ncbi:MAG: 2-C-methyl-D-erythritol 2,4-cyclodiphosphate synthase [Odoribacteraceae bacterium]|jgi:2-C-methyl-D-erythritol 2,4-cyclodiphosphate synthase|nr:2-C-methyl-D-erythritol 2,4-cyclodiphosphate synthase [Odoribacteraceae bacterium]